ncbi:MAG: AmmeMemoRadiSam system protein B [Patescibacteria group bacterium]|nr:AmmeMemoRadiSam system protein B [Patescibacteria group bacterium]
MKKDKIPIFIFLIFAVLLFVFVFYIFKQSFVLHSSLARFSQNDFLMTLQDNNFKDSQSVIIKLSEIFFEENNFSHAVSQADEVKAQDNVEAIIIPHHLVASEFIAKLIKISSGRDIDNVVIIGPNHKNIGTESLASAKADWETPFGNLEHDNNLVQSFLRDFKAESYPEIFLHEHSIGGLAPFVKYYLKDVQIVPIVVSSYADYADIDKLNKWLIQNLDENSLVIFSLDFSHYLTKEESDEKDAETRDLIVRKDIGKILRLNNDYVDSPSILALSLMYTEEKGLKINIINHANSFDFAVVKPDSTTSYFAIIFESSN